MCFQLKYLNLIYSNKGQDKDKSSFRLRLYRPACWTEHVRMDGRSSGLVGEPQPLRVVEVQPELKRGLFSFFRLISINLFVIATTVAES